jgi:hypothetical protein
MIESNGLYVRIEGKKIDIYKDLMPDLTSEVSANEENTTGSGEETS